MDDMVEVLGNTVDKVKKKVHDRLEGKFHRKQTIGIISAPCNAGDKFQGTAEGPSVIKKTGFIRKLRDDEFDVEEIGRVELEPPYSLEDGPNGMKNFEHVLEFNKLLSQKVKKVLEEKDLCIALGGDHHLPIGCVTGLADLNRKHQVKLIHVDAHADIHTGSSSESKDMNGCVLSFLLGRETKRLNGWPSPSLSIKDVVWIGLRDMDPAEIEFLDNNPDVLYFDAKKVKTLGIKNVMQSCLEKLNPGPKSPLYVSFDIDALDSHVAPCTVPIDSGKGLTMEEGKFIVQSAFCTGYLRGLDICGVNPHLGNSADVGLTAHAAYNLIVSIAKKNIPKSEAQRV